MPKERTRKVDDVANWTDLILSCQSTDEAKLDRAEAWLRNLAPKDDLVKRLDRAILFASLPGFWTEPRDAFFGLLAELWPHPSGFVQLLIRDEELDSPIFEVGWPDTPAIACTHAHCQMIYSQKEPTS